MTVDRDAQRLLDMIALAGRPAMESLSPRRRGRCIANPAARCRCPPPEVAEAYDFTARGVPARFYRGVDAVAGRGLLYLHGGGWVLGDLNSHDNVCRTLANAAQCRVVAAQYRLAPEHPFPAALEDAAALLAYLAAEGAALGVAPGQLAVVGDSAGGQLAALLALRGRDGLGPPLCQQALLYPATDLSCDHPSYDTFTAGLPLTAGSMRWFRDHYLGGADPAQPAISPLRAALHGLPPAFVLTAGNDPLRDEGLAYADGLDRAGVAVTHLHMAAQVHGFLTMDRVIRDAATALAMAGAWLRHGWPP